MTKHEINNEVGKKPFLADDNTIAGLLIYISGINEFDEYLGEKDQKDLGCVIHINEYPNGLILKLVKNFSAITLAQNYKKITNIALVKSSKYSIIKITVDNKQMYFGFDNDDSIEIINFFKKLNYVTFDENSKFEIPKEVTTKLETYLVKHTDVLPIDIANIVASKQKRFFNYVIDLIVMSILYLLLLGDQFDNQSQVWLQSWLIALLYYGIMEAAFTTTIGKLITNTKVVKNDGTKADEILIRTYCRLIPFESLSFLGSGKGWHDRLSKTIVIDKGLRKKYY
jgi:uncharacterized RDD family membrane protein YckC